LFGNWSVSEGLAITKLLSFMWVSRSFTGPFATRWKPAVLKGLGNKEVTAALKMAALNASILPKVIAVSVA